MNEALKLRFRLLVLAALMICVPPAGAQEPPRPAPHLCAARCAGSLSGPFFLLDAAVATQKPAPSQKPNPPADHAARISPQQAEELFRSVDSILQWVGKETALEIKHPVKRQLSSPAEVQSYVEERIKTDEDAKRLERSELVVKKFGLLARDFDLSKFLVRLLREQVVGFYDPKKQTVFLLNWVEPEEQKPVLAHELTHALQDQNFDLEKWMRAGAPPGGGASSKEKDPRKLQEEIDADERQAARQAVGEGQGMAVLVDYLLAPTGRNLLTAPEFVTVLKQGMTTGGDSPIFASAPIFLKESLTFPYRYGLDFMQTLLGEGKERAFAGALKNPPVDTRQIMEPKRYLAGEQVPAVPLPDFAAVLGKNWERFDVGGVGEFDIRLIVEQFGAESAARRLAPAWRGGYYYAAGKRGEKLESTAGLSMIYVSRWASEDEARDFSHMYAASIARKYQSARATTGASANPQRWTTEEGPVMLEIVGDLVVVTESFEPALAAKLRDAAVAAAKPKIMAQDERRFAPPDRPKAAGPTHVSPF